MGRIDEALKRAAGAHSTGPSSAQQELFVSAWGGAKPAAVSAPAPPAREAAPAIPRFERARNEKPTLERNGSLARLSAEWGKRLVTAGNPEPALVEQFRRLAAALHKAQSAQDIKVVMVTSATPADGKTLTAVNLALVLSGSYKRRVLLIDADLRRPTIGEAAGFKNSVGLSEALKGRDEQKLQLIPVTPTLTLLPAGQPDPDPLAGLTSPRMRHILEDAASNFDWVILDAPPVGLLADAGLMADVVQRTVFVVRAGHSQFPSVRSAIDALGHERLLGIVLNGVESGAGEIYGSGYKYVSAEGRS